MAGQIIKTVARVEVHGTGPLTGDNSISLEIMEGGKFYCHLWRAQRSGGRIGTPFNRPEALREYARGLLELTERFEAEARPVWEANGGAWMNEEERKRASEPTDKKETDHA